MSFFAELKRRNVIRVAAAYVVSAWLVIQVVETIFPAFGFGDAAVRYVVVGFTAAFVPVLILAWAFEWTPQGLKRDADVDRAQPAAPGAGKIFDRVVMVILALAVGFFAFDKFVLDPARDAVEIQDAREEGRTEALVESYGDKSIAVIPFVNLSSDPEQAFFADGVAEEVLNLLARIPQLRVISRSSSFTFRGENLEVPKIAAQLSVAHILEGSVRRSGDRIRITAQLIEARSDTHLWSETYDRTLNDIFAIQDEIAEKIVENLHVELVGPMPRARPTDPVALALTMQAKQVFYDEIMGTITGGADRMTALLDRALEIDPDYTEAMAWQVYANWLRGQDGLITSEEQQRRFDELADRALAIDPEQAMFLQMKAMDLLFKTTDLAAAAPLYDRALKSAPNNSEILRQLGRFAYILERYEESHALLERAVAIDPLCSHCLYFLSRAYMISRDWDKAEEARDRYLLLGGRGGYLHYGTIKLMQGKADEALEIFTDPDKVDEYQAAFGQALALFSLGRSAEADVALARMIDERGELATHDVAKVYAWRNQPDVAFEWLDKFADLATGDEDHRFGMVNSVHSPLYQNLHDDPRWETYRERAGLSTGLVESIEIDLSIPE